MRYVIVTLGARGRCWSTAEDDAPGAGVPVEAVDTTAAGDAFNGGLACAWPAACRWTRPCARRASSAALSATRLGAQPSLPTTAELQEFAEKVGK